MFLQLTALNKKMVIEILFAYHASSNLQYPPLSPMNRKIWNFNIHFIFEKKIIINLSIINYRLPVMNK